MKCEIAENQSGSAIVVHCGPEETRVQFMEPKVDENGMPRDEFEVCATLLEQAAAAIRAAAPPAGETAPGEETQEAREARERQERRERFNMFTDPGSPAANEPGYKPAGDRDQSDRPEPKPDESLIRAQKAELGLDPDVRSEPPPDNTVPLQQTPPQGSTVPAEMPENQVAAEKNAREAEKIQPLTGTS